MLRDLATVAGCLALYAAVSVAVLIGALLTLGLFR